MKLSLVDVFPLHVALHLFVLSIVKDQRAYFAYACHFLHSGLAAENQLFLVDMLCLSLPKNRRPFIVRKSDAQSWDLFARSGRWPNPINIKTFLQQDGGEFNWFKADWRILESALEEIIWWPLKIDLTVLQLLSKERKTSKPKLPLDPWWRFNHWVGTNSSSWLLTFVMAGHPRLCFLTLRGQLIYLLIVLLPCLAKRLLRWVAMHLLIFYHYAFRDIVDDLHDLSLKLLLRF